MGYKYIAIEREYGSGGSKIAHSLAKECNISCYGQEILEEVSKTHGVSIEEIQKSEENVTNSFLYTLYAIGQIQSGNTNVLSSESKLFLEEQKVIRKFAMNGSAVYLGHCAFEALKDLDVVKVFIRCSDKDLKLKRICEEYNISKSECESTRKRFDNKRSKYYFANTSNKWDNLTNYDIVLDSATLGIEGCVAVLKGLIKNNVSN